MRRSKGTPKVSRLRPLHVPNSGPRTAAAAAARFQIKPHSQAMPPCRAASCACPATRQRAKGAEPQADSESARSTYNLSEGDQPLLMILKIKGFSAAAAAAACDADGAADAGWAGRRGPFRGRFRFISIGPKLFVTAVPNVSLRSAYRLRRPTCGAGRPCALCSGPVDNGPASRQRALLFRPVVVVPHRDLREEVGPLAQRFGARYFVLYALERSVRVRTAMAPRVGRGRCRRLPWGIIRLDDLCQHMVDDLDDARRYPASRNQDLPPELAAETRKEFALVDAHEIPVVQVPC